MQLRGEIIQTPLKLAWKNIYTKQSDHAYNSRKNENLQQKPQVAIEGQHFTGEESKHFGFGGYNVGK